MIYRCICFLSREILSFYYSVSQTFSIRVPPIRFLLHRVPNDSRLPFFAQI